jgi:hypothetical protein
VLKVHVVRLVRLVFRVLVEQQVLRALKDQQDHKVLVEQQVLQALKDHKVELGQQVVLDFRGYLDQQE